MPRTVYGAQETSTLIPSVHKALDCFHIDKLAKPLGSYLMPSAAMLLSAWLYIYKVVYNDNHCLTQNRIESFSCWHFFAHTAET